MIEKMKTGSDPFIVHSIININKQELGKDYGEEWQNITKSQWQAARFMFYQKYWICLSTSEILVGICRRKQRSGVQWPQNKVMIDFKSE